MTPPNVLLATICLTRLFVETSAQGTIKPSLLHFQLANVGENVTLPCSCHNYNAITYYWYKQSRGQTPELVTLCVRNSPCRTFYNDFKHGRFSWEVKQLNYQLNISNVQISDSGTYYCTGSNSHKIEFCEATVLSVKGSALIYQTESETIQSGDSVTLNCTVHTGSCGGEHSVYWFRDSGESHPQLIHTKRGTNGQCEREENTQRQKCEYNLPMKSLNLSDTGTYYCAVASCRHIVIGNGTRLDMKPPPDEVDPRVPILSAALSFATVLLVLLSLIVYKMYKRGHPRTEFAATFSASTTQNSLSFQSAENLHYAALKDLNIRRSRGKRNNTSSECVYAAVKQ